MESKNNKKEAKTRYSFKIAFYGNRGQRKVKIVFLAPTVREYMPFKKYYVLDLSLSYMIIRRMAAVV